MVGEGVSSTHNQLCLDHAIFVLSAVVRDGLGFRVDALGLGVDALGFGVDALCCSSFGSECDDDVSVL